jgi:hypothetical protein
MACRLGPWGAVGCTGVRSGVVECGRVRRHSATCKPLRVWPRQALRFDKPAQALRGVVHVVLHGALHGALTVVTKRFTRPRHPPPAAPSRRLPGSAQGPGSLPRQALGTPTIPPRQNESARNAGGSLFERVTGQHGLS